jgi:hypothetical protein
VFYGGRPPDAAADLILTGEFQDDWFGHAVGGAGDGNGDGFDDILVGAPFFDRRSVQDPASAVGRIYMFFGGAPPDVNPDRVLTGTQMDEQFGWSLAGGVDVDGDGLDDVAGGARFFDDGPASAAGRVVVAYGSSGTDFRTGPRLVGLAADDQFGHDVALLGVPPEPGAVAGGAVFTDVAGSGAGEAARLSLRCLALTAATITMQASACKDFESVSFYRGRLADLVLGDPGACVARIASPATSIEDPGEPASGEGFFYLVTGRGADLEGHPGFRSDGSGRPRPVPCP